MSLSLLLSMVGIAFVDSLNPSLFVAQFYLLTTSRPVPRIASYIAGILAVNFVGGILILTGARVVIGDLFNSLNPDVLHVLHLALGIALLIFGLTLRLTGGEGPEARKPRSLHPVHTFLLGMVVMLNEITTALPYFVAIEQIAQAHLTSPQALVALVVYNLIFGAPLFAFLLLFVAYRERFTSQIAAISRFVQVWTPRLLKYGSLALGVVLVVNAGIYLLGRLAG